MEFKRFRHLVAFLLMIVAVAARGTAEPETAPDKLVEQVTDSLVTDISTYRESLEAAGTEEKRKAVLQQFYREIMATLEPVVDFNWISLNVMGPYRKEASDAQREQFRDVFTRGLVETYGRGLLTYSDQEIVVQPLKEELEDKRRVAVKQEIRGKDQSYPLQYSMAMNRDGEWKVINVIINGINLGQTFRNQFVQAAESHNGDIDKVIANWTAGQVYEKTSD